VVELPAVQNLLAGWWFVYDQADVDAWPDFFTADAHFSCRSDSGATAFEDFIRADVRGRDEVLAWQTEHRRNSPYPLRHNGTNVHLTAARADGADFRSYILVTHVVAGAVSNLASGVCTGTARAEDGSLRLADLALVLDFTDSEPLAAIS
jgi:SnoaL-like domain